MTAHFSQVDNLRWNGQPVLRARMTLDEAIAALPRFRVAPFGEGDNNNPNLHAIVREHWGLDSRQVPVAVASPDYVLLQHPDILANVRLALKQADAPLANEPAQIHVSPLGERLECRFRFKTLSFDPGDGFPLHLQLLVRNSVDGSSAFEISLRWMRQVCSNGMCVLTKEDRLREVHHRERFDIERIGTFIHQRARVAVATQQRLKSWSRERVSQGELGEWIRDDVRKTWGPLAAVRLRHICASGHDGKPDVLPGRKLPALDSIALRGAKPVPGAIAPASSLYAVYQALTWIADHRGNVEDREAWGAQAFDLLGKLATRHRVDLAA